MNSPGPAFGRDRAGTVKDVPRESRWRQLIVLAVALGALAFAWANMAFISRSDPWYRNTDMNSHNMVDALAINSNVLPRPFDQPAVPLKYLLALDYRIRHALGALPIWNLRKFGASANLLREIPPLIRIERVHSRILVIIFILAAAWLTYSVTSNLDAACLSVILLCGSAGLLFHGLLSRPELLCVGFGNVLALLCTWRALATRSWFGNHAWLFLAGIFVGLSTLEKLPGVCYLGLCYGWCWLAALTPSSSEPSRNADRPAYWGGLLPAVAGAAVLALLFQLGKYQDELGPVVLMRLRAAAVVIALLPLLLPCPERNRLGIFLRDRCRELVVLGGGVSTSLLLTYLLLRGVMSASNAANYFAGALHFVVNPAPYMKDLLNAKPETGRMFMTFVMQTPVLFAGATAMAFGILLQRSLPLRLKAFIVLLWVGAVGMTVVMGRRHYLAQYDIFLQVPLLLVLALSLSGMGNAWQRQRTAKASHWRAPLILTAAFLVVLTSYFRLQPIYTHYQDDAALPVNDLTLTFLFDHTDHTPAYVKIMKDHYGDREQFAAALARFLADPANRY